MMVTKSMNSRMRIYLAECHAGKRKTKMAKKRMPLAAAREAAPEIVTSLARGVCAKVKGYSTYAKIVLKLTSGATGNLLPDS